MPTTSPPLRLANAYISIPEPDRYRVQAGIDPAVGSYLFKRVEPSQGVPQKIISTFFKKLYEECLRRGVGLPTPNSDPSLARWDDTNEQQLAQILSDLNFNPNPQPASNVRTRKPRSKPTS